MAHYFRRLFGSPLIVIVFFQIFYMTWQIWYFIISLKWSISCIISSYLCRVEWSIFTGIFKVHSYMLISPFSFFIYYICSLTLPEKFWEILIHFIYFLLIFTYLIYSVVLPSWWLINFCLLPLFIFLLCFLVSYFYTFLSHLLTFLVIQLIDWFWFFLVN